MSTSNEIRVFDYVNHSYAQVKGALVGGPLETFQAATSASADRARAVAAELHVNIGAIDVGTEIAIEIKSVSEKPKEGFSGPSTTIELQWEAARSPRLFPLMRAELSIYPLTATETQLDLLGHYEPPMGAVGKALDAMVGHRIAEASVHRFIRNVAEFLRSSLSDPR